MEKSIIRVKKAKKKQDAAAGYTPQTPAGAHRKEKRTLDALTRKKERSNPMTKFNWKLWFKAAGIRALKTVAETIVATIGTTAAISKVDWLLVASSAALAGLLSLLTSIAGLPEVKAETGK